MVTWPSKDKHILPGKEERPIRRSRNLEIQSSGLNTSKDLQGKLGQTSQQILILQGNWIVPSHTLQLYQQSGVREGGWLE